MTDNRTTEFVDEPDTIRNGFMDDGLLMSDNRTTELREKLTERGVEYTANDGEHVKETCWPYMGELMAAFAEFDNGTTRFACDTWCFTPEQAIAATLGSERHPYEQRITGDGSDWGEIMRDAYDDLMASACESCTPEQMEQLADYIRAELGSGTCKNDWAEFGKFKCSECGLQVDSISTGTTAPIPIAFCPRCGKKVML